MQWQERAGGAGFSSGTPWRPPYPDYATRNVAAEAADPASLWNHYRKIDSPAQPISGITDRGIRSGGKNTARLYAMLRYSDDQAFLVLVNPYPEDLNTENYALSLPELPFSGAITAEAVLGEAGLGEAGCIICSHPRSTPGAGLRIIILLTSSRPSSARLSN